MVSKRLSALLLALLLTLACCSALAAVSSVIDDANLYTLEEEAQLQLLIDQVRDQYQMDAVVLTTYDVPQSYGDDSVTVRCKKCGRSATVPATSVTDAHAFLNADSLTLT